VARRFPEKQQFWLTFRGSAIRDHLAKLFTYKSLRAGFPTDFFPGTKKDQASKKPLTRPHLMSET
jgi:hypothetical protein